MKWNTAMRFVMARAQAEAAAAGNSTIGITHIFLGLLKLSELTANDISPTSRHQEQLDAEIGAVRARLSELGIDSTQMRGRLRRLLKTKEAPVDGTGPEELLQTAARGQEEAIPAIAVLAVILDHPTPLIREVYPLNGTEANEAREVPDCPPEEEPLPVPPELRSENWETRKKAIPSIHKKAVLAKVLQEDPDWRVRAAVTRSIYQQAPLERAAFQDTDWRVRFLAVKRLYPYDSPVLAQVAANDPRAEVRRAAVVLLRDHAALSRVACSDEDSGVREAAVAGLHRNQSYHFTVTDIGILFSTPEEESALQIARRFEGVFDDALVAGGWRELAARIARAKTQTQYLRLEDFFLAGRASSVYFIRLKPEADGMVAFSVIESRGSHDKEWAAEPDRLFDGEKTYGDVYRFCLPYRELLTAVENVRIENDFVLNAEYDEQVYNWEVEEEEQQWESARYVAVNGDEARAREAVGELTSQWDLACVARRGKSWKARLAAVETLTDQAALAEVALKDQNGNVRKRAVEKLNDQKALVKIALKEDDSLVSCAAVNRLDDQSLLTRVALKAVIGFTREAAIQRLTDQTVLVKIALKDDGHLVNYAAVERLTDQHALRLVALKAPMSTTRELAVKRLTDQEALAKIARKDKDDSVRCTAVENLNNQEVLIQLALEDDDWYLRKVAVTKLDDQSVLAQVALTDRHLDVREAAVKRLHDQSALVRVLLSRFWESGRLSLAMKVYFGALSNLTDQEALYRVVSDCIISEIREAAAKKLTEEGLLLRILSEEPFQKAEVIRRIAVERLTNQAKLIEIARSYPGALVRRGVVYHLEDPPTLEALALGDPNWKLRRAAVGKLDAQAVLLRIAQTDAHELVRLEALLRLGDKSLLCAFLQTAGTEARKKALNRMEGEEALFLHFALHDSQEWVCRAAAQRLHEDDSLEAVLRHGTGAAQLAAAQRTGNMTLLAEIAISSDRTMLQRIALLRSDRWTLPQLMKMAGKTKGINLGLARKRLNSMGGKYDRT